MYKYSNVPAPRRARLLCRPVLISGWTCVYMSVSLCRYASMVRMSGQGGQEGALQSKSENVNFPVSPPSWASHGVSPWVLSLVLCRPPLTQSPLVQLRCLMLVTLRVLGSQCSVPERREELGPRKPPWIGIGSRDAPHDWLSSPLARSPGAIILALLPLLPATPSQPGCSRDRKRSSASPRTHPTSSQARK